MLTSAAPICDRDRDHPGWAAGLRPHLRWCSAAAGQLPSLRRMPHGVFKRPGLAEVAVVPVDLFQAHL